MKLKPRIAFYIESWITNIPLGFYIRPKKMIICFLFIAISFNFYIYLNPKSDESNPFIKI